MPSINRKESKLPWKAALPKSNKSWGYDTDFYRTKRWRNTRQAKINANPLCEECERQGMLITATVVDHIQPRRQRQDLELDWDNLQSLCEKCHNTKSSAEGRGSKNLQKAPLINRCG